MIYSFDYIGEALTHQKIVPGNTATAFDANCYTYKEFNLFCDGVDAGSTEPTAGTWIVDQTSGARAVVISATLTAGAWGNANARVTLRLKSLSGTFGATNAIGIGANLDHFTVRANTVQNSIPDDYLHKGTMARYVLIQFYGALALVSFEGFTPDQTALIGQEFSPYSGISLKDINTIKAFKVIDKVSGSACTVQATFYF